MKILFAVCAVQFLFVVMTINCGFSMSSGNSHQTATTDFPQKFELWEGTYKGTVKVFFGDGTDSRGYPAKFTISRYSKDAVMTLKVPYMKRTWSFVAKPSFFSTLTANITSVSVNAGTTYSYEFNGTLEDVSLTGSMDIIRMSERGSPTSKWNYMFDFTKEK